MDIVHYHGDLASCIKDGCIRNVFKVTALASVCIVIVVTGSIAFTHKLPAHNNHFPNDILYHLPKSSAVRCIKQQATVQAT